MRSPSLSSAAAAVAALLIVTGPGLTVGVAAGPRHLYPQRIDMLHLRSDSLLPSAASGPAAQATSGGAAVLPSSTVAVEHFQLNILNRQKPDKELWVYIQAYDAGGSPGFLVPPPADRPGEVATWFMPDGPAPSHTAEGSLIINPAVISREKIGFKLDKNTGGDGGKPPVRSMMLPSYINSGRVYLSEDELDFKSHRDPNNLTKIEVDGPSVLSAPANKTNFGFVELTWLSPKGEGDERRGLWANLSFVDWVGVVLGMSVREHGETDVVKQIVPGLKETPKGVLHDICDALTAASKKAGNYALWDNLCIRDQAGTPLRVLSPNLFLSQGKGENGAATAEGKFYEDYVNQVWTRYAQTPLKVDTQIWPVNSTRGPWTEGENGTGAICECKTDPEIMKCGGKDCVELAAGKAEALWFPKPSDLDIFSCNSGAFGQNSTNITLAHNDINLALGRNDTNLAYAQLRSRLCAGFVRSTLLLDDITPSVKVREDKYYLNDIHDYYSEIVHRSLEGRRGYTFSFDDVNPANDNSAGVIEVQAPEVMNIVVGGWKDGDELFVTK